MQAADLHVNRMNDWRNKYQSDKLQINSDTVILCNSDQIRPKWKMHHRLEMLPFCLFQQCDVGFRHANIYCCCNAHVMHALVLLGRHTGWRGRFRRPCQAPVAALSLATCTFLEAVMTMVTPIRWLADLFLASGKYPVCTFGRSLYCLLFL